MFTACTLDAMREELAATVRSVSPFAVALLGEAGLDVAMERMEPVSGWPRHPLIGPGPGLNHTSHALREWYAQGPRKGVGSNAPRSGERARARVIAAGGSEIMVHVVDHSVEVSGRLSRARLETGFGVLRIELDDALPDTLLAALPGRAVETVFDHASLRGWGWLVTEVEEELEPFFGTTVSVETGALPYVVPWAR